MTREQIDRAARYHLTMGLLEVDILVDFAIKQVNAALEEAVKEALSHWYVYEELPVSQIAVGIRALKIK